MRGKALRIGLGVLALSIVTALAGAPATAADDEPAPQAHPRFDDGGTLDWRTRIGEAMELAAERRRLIFVEWGRES